MLVNDPVLYCLSDFTNMVNLETNPRLIKWVVLTPFFFNVVGVVRLCGYIGNGDTANSLAEFTNY